MANDIKLVWDNINLLGDLEFSAGDLVRENGLETAVLISLFCDRRAEDDDILDDPKDRRGWWGDFLNADVDDVTGSKWWQLDRAKATQDTANLYKDYTYEALDWMVEDEVIENVEVETWIYGDVWNRRLAIEIKILQNDGTNFAIKFEDLWSGQYSTA